MLFISEMAKFLDKIFFRHRPKDGDRHYGFREMGALLFRRGSFRTNQSMKLSAVYRCVNCISDSIAQLPLEIFRIDAKGFKKKDRKNPLFTVLNAKPNNRMTRYTFMVLLIQSMLLKGNGFAYIKRKDGKVDQLVFIPAEYVSIVPPRSIFEPIEYIITGIKQRIPASDMIHIVNQTIDGVVGVSTLEYARLTLGLAHDSEQHAANFFGSGCAVGGILTSKTRLTDEQAEAAKRSWNGAFNSSTGETNGVAVLSAEFSYQPVTINARDSQLLETRQFNVIEICRFFGVSPVKVFDYTKSSYSTVEATNIGYLTDTVSPLLEKIELEFETKLFPGEPIDVRFDVSQLLRADKQSLAQYYSTMFQIGAISINEIRQQIDLPYVKGGDTNFIQVNMQPLEKAIADDQEEDKDNETELNNGLQSSQQS